MIEFYREMSKSDRDWHDEIAKKLKVGAWYRFEPHLLLAPLDEGGEFIEIPMAEFVRWRKYGVFKDCVFRVRLGRSLTALEVAVLFKQGEKVFLVKT